MLRSVAPQSFGAREKRAPATEQPEAAVDDWQARRRSVRRHLNWLGLTIDAWARANGYKPKQVYRVLSGENKGLYGTAHDIAVKLNLKDGELRAEAEGRADRDLADAHLVLRWPLVAWPDRSPAGPAKCSVCGGEIAGCRPTERPTDRQAADPIA